MMELEQELRLEPELSALQELAEEERALARRALAGDTDAGTVAAIVLAVLLAAALCVIATLWLRKTTPSRRHFKYAFNDEDEEEVEDEEEEDSGNGEDYGTKESQNDFPNEATMHKQGLAGPGEHQFEGPGGEYEGDTEGDDARLSASGDTPGRRVFRKRKSPAARSATSPADARTPPGGSPGSTSSSSSAAARRAQRRAKRSPAVASTPEEELIGRVKGLNAASVLGIDLSKLRLGPSIGEGANGRVFRGTYMGSNVAIKEIMSLAPVDDVEHHFVTELEALRRLRHPHVVELYGAAVTRSLVSADRLRYLLVTELAPCSLRDLLDSDEVITFKQALRLATELSKGCAYLHAMKVVHFDIKPANVLLSDSGRVKICDLGVSRLGSNAAQGKGSGESAIRGTPTYAAPEIMRGKTALLSYGVDVYSFSILFWELLHRRNPFPKSWTLAVLFNRVLDGHRPAIGPLVPARLRRLIMQCWDPISIRRPEFENILVELAWSETEMRHPERAFLSTHLVEVWFEGKFRNGRISRNVGQGNYEVVLQGEIQERTFPASEIVLTDGGGGVTTTLAVANEVEGKRNTGEDGIVFHVVNDEGPRGRTGAGRGVSDPTGRRDRRGGPVHGSSTGAGSGAGASGDADSSESWQGTTASTGFTNTPTPTSRVSGSSGTEDLLSDDASWDRDTFSVDIEGIRIGEYGIITPQGDLDDDNSPSLARTHRGNFRADLVVLNEVGRGASGVVHRALQLKNFQLVAIKSIRVKDSLSRYQIAKEIRALDAVVKSSPTSQLAVNLTQMYGAYWEPEDASVRIVLEYMDGGSCDDMLINWRPPSEHLLAAIAIGTLKGMQQLHSSFRLHRDIKPANVLIDKRKGAKLSDLGLARDMMAQEGAKDHINDALAETFVGTISYMSPERLEGKSYSYAADVWALGVTLTSLAIGKNPFRNYSFFQLLEYFQQSAVPTVPDTYTEDLRDFLAQCLQKLPQDRATTEQLLSHPWITAYERGELPDPLGILRQYISDASEGSRYKRNDLNYISSRVNEHLRQYLGSQNGEEPTQVVVPVSKVRNLAAQLGLPTRHVVKGFKSRK
ncbi:Protein kinase, putative [Hondaea fermentalgiana]|uniref:mitogen-activated protein kinase kinase n=1 Tax=Hondaea fermentalgiana TaxID=2315210 RepID=A0A2R5G1B1_9STRA|nr:Protein kinase, putative [Hondaea fermentalgiana]|eukprot:GBG24315.1 Protein kinase, putative [Hondaea fermentalgiana]